MRRVHNPMQEYILDNRVHVVRTTGNFVMGWFGHIQQAAPSWFIMDRGGKVLHSGRRRYIVPLYNKRYDYSTETYSRYHIARGVRQGVREALAHQKRTGLLPWQEKEMGA